MARSACPDLRKQTGLGGRPTVRAWACSARAHWMAELPVTPMLKLPLGSSALQLKHRPPVRLVCPAGQGWQPAGSPATEEQPARHCVHTAAPAADLLPAGQYVHSAAPPAELLPAGHCSQPGAHVAGWLPGAQVELGCGQPGAHGHTSDFGAGRSTHALQAADMLRWHECM